MDVKGGVHNLRKLEEVGISCVGSTASKDTLQKVGEFGKSPWLVRENEITVALNVHLVVQHDLPWLVVFVAAPKIAPCSTTLGPPLRHMFNKAV